MRKILFVCAILFCGVNYGFGLPVTTLQTKGGTCQKTPSGKVVCNYIDRGGGYEENICWRKKGGDNDKAAADEEESGNYFVKKKGTDCTAKKNGASWAQCIDNVLNSKETTRSCAAFDCKSGYLLYTTNTRREIPVVSENRKVGSQGLCREKSYLKSLCDVGCGCDEPREKCVLNEVAVTNHGRTVQAFIGEELCVCEKDLSYVEPGPCDHLMGAEKECCLLEKVAKQPVQWNKEEGICECTDKTKELKDGQCVDKNGGTPDVEGDCRYTFRGVVKCNGKTIYKFKSFKITPEMAKTMKLPGCKDGEIIDVNTRFKEDSDEFKKIVAEFCKNPVGNGGVIDNDGGNDYEYLDAKNRIDAFMRSASSNASVWKNAEGQFNTARLASDLTAGVVLGTVGGIVSANVIKKKQLEKGFDALHCTVGGQTVADWGDEFSVGFRRY